MKQSTNRKRWIVGLMGVILALCLAPVMASAVDGTEGDPAPQADAVAKIGDVEYESLDAAIEAAKAGDTIYLLADATVSKTLNKTMTIDGQNHTLTSTDVRYGFGVKGETISLTFKNMTANFSYSEDLGSGADLALFYINANTDFTFENVTLNMDGQGVPDRLHGFYFDGGSTGTFTLSDSMLTIKNFPEDAFEWSGSSSNLIISHSTFTSDNNRSGLAGTFNANIIDSTVNVCNSAGNGSNGTNFEIENSVVYFNNNGSHGLSAGALSIDNSTVEAIGNHGMGITVNNAFTVKNSSKVTVTGNADNTGYGYAGVRLYNDFASSVDSTSELYIKDNHSTGLYVRQGSFNVAEGAVLEITGNKVSHTLLDGFGGGVYVGYGANYDPSVVLPADAVIYNNHSLNGGDDIYVSEGVNGPSLTFGEVGTDWVLDGNPDCTDAIDGWYDDSENARWEAHNSPVHAVKKSAGTVTGLTALKAAHGLVPLDPTDPDLPEWATSKSKSATQLDENYESDVTLSLPAAEEKLVTDVVFVLDESSCSEPVKEQVRSMLGNLYERVEGTDAAIKVGAVQFRGEVTEFPLTELSDTTKDDLAEFMSSRPETGGSNLSAGLIAGEAMLDADTEVDAGRKYLIVVSDGITYIWDDEATAEQENYGINFANGDAPTTPMLAGPDGWDVKYGNKYVPSSWSTWLAGVQPLVEQTINDKASLYDRNNPTADKSFVAYSEKDSYLSTVDVALYKSYQQYQEIASKYRAYVVMTGVETEMATYPYGPSFMNWMANGKSVSFDEIEKEVFYLLDAGSSVVDVIGYGTDNLEAEYNFDFVDSLDNLNLTVGGKTLDKEAIASDKVSADVNATSAYGFGKQADGSYDFELWYYEKGQDGASDECFVWKINTAVSNFAPVQLTYTVELTNPSYLAGEHGAYDEYGTAQLPGLLTNTVATLYPVDSNGNQGVPENFYRPTVSYEVGTVKVYPADMTIYMGGNQGYDTVINGSGDTVVAEETNSLPEPGFYIDLSDDLNELLRDAQNTENPAATDLSDRITFRTVSGDREWKFERYGGETGSTAYNKFVYRLVPAAGQQPIRLEFKSGDTYFTSDDFDPVAEGSLYNQYEMGVYAGDVNLNQILMDITIDGKTYTKVVQVDTATLTIRYVVDTDNGNPVTGVVNDINDAEKRGESAYAVVSPNATFFINGSQIDITGDAAPSLLFDSIVSNESGAEESHFDTKLLDKATATIAGQDEDFQVSGHESKYLDLVDANNGNAWLMTDSAVTVYWPYPEGTDQSTEFHLVHFQGLDRDMTNAEVDGQIDATEPEYISVTNTEHGVMFTLQPKLGEDGNARVRFSPFVLVWGASSTTPDPEPEPTPEPVTARFVAQKKLEGATLKDGQFTFELKDKSGKVVANAKNDANGTIVFEGLSFSEVGTYEYTISEVNDGQEGITYDTSVKGCYVKVTEKDGKLVAEAFAREELVFTNTATTTSEPEPEPEPGEPGEPTQPSEPTEPTEPTTPVEPGTPDVTVPNTGDPTSVAAVASLLVAGIGAGAAGIVLRRRSK